MFAVHVRCSFPGVSPFDDGIVEKARLRHQRRTYQNGMSWPYCFREPSLVRRTHRVGEKGEKWGQVHISLTKWGQVHISLGQQFSVGNARKCEPDPIFRVSQT